MKAKAFGPIIGSKGRFKQVYKPSLQIGQEESKASEDLRTVREEQVTRVSNSDEKQGSRGSSALITKHSVSKMSEVEGKVDESAMRLHEEVKSPVVIVDS